MLRSAVADFARPSATLAFVWRSQGGFAAAGARLRSIIAALTDPYRPELHYMRGPGPKWRAKHARVDIYSQR